MRHRSLKRKASWRDRNLEKVLQSTSNDEINQYFKQPRLAKIKVLSIDDIDRFLAQVTPVSSRKRALLEAVVAPKRVTRSQSTINQSMSIIDRSLQAVREWQRYTVAIDWTPTVPNEWAESSTVNQSSQSIRAEPLRPVQLPPHVPSEVAKGAESVQVKDGIVVSQCAAPTVPNRWTEPAGSTQDRKLQYSDRRGDKNFLRELLRRRAYRQSIDNERITVSEKLSIDIVRESKDNEIPRRCYTKDSTTILINEKDQERHTIDCITIEKKRKDTVAEKMISIDPKGTSAISIGSEMDTVVKERKTRVWDEGLKEDTASTAKKPRDIVTPSSACTIKSTVPYVEKADSKQKMRPESAVAAANVLIDEDSLPEDIAPCPEKKNTARDTVAGTEVSIGKEEKRTIQRVEKKKENVAEATKPSIEKALKTEKTTRIKDIPEAERYWMSERCRDSPIQRSIILNDATTVYKIDRIALEIIFDSEVNF